MYNNYENIYLFIVLFILLVFSGILIPEVNGIRFHDPGVPIESGQAVNIDLPEFNEEVYLQHNKTDIPLPQLGNLFILFDDPLKNKVSIETPAHKNPVLTDEVKQEKLPEPPPLYFIVGYFRSDNTDYLYVKDAGGKMTKVRTGSKLEDDFVVKEIRKFRMVIEKNGKEYVIEKN